MNGRTITLLGDLKNGRTVHSLVTILCLYSVNLNFVSPPGLSMPTNVVTAARRAGISVRLCEDLEEVLADTDVLYVTRVQKERFESDEEWARMKNAYRVDHSVLARAKPEMIVMHPLPRLAGTCLSADCIGLYGVPCFRNRPRSRLRFPTSGLFPSDALWPLCACTPRFHLCLLRHLLGSDGFARKYHGLVAHKTKRRTLTLVELMTNMLFLRIVHIPLYI